MIGGLTGKRLLDCRVTLRGHALRLRSTCRLLKLVQSLFQSVLLLNAHQRQVLELRVLLILLRPARAACAPPVHLVNTRGLVGLTFMHYNLRALLLVMLGLRGAQGVSIFIHAFGCVHFQRT